MAFHASSDNRWITTIIESKFRPWRTKKTSTQGENKKKPF
jgi:hypothetical protein